MVSKLKMGFILTAMYFLFFELSGLLTDILLCCVALRMVAAEMTSNQDKDVTQVQYVDISPDFLTTGRTGRRNALPDILGEHKLTSTADLPDRLQALTTNGKIIFILTSTFFLLKIKHGLIYNYAL